MEIQTILLAILHIESIRELHLLPASEGIQSFLAIIAIDMDIESQAFQASKLIHIERYEIIYVVFSQLHIDGFHLLVVSYHLNIGYLCIFLHRKQETLLVLTLLADAVETVVIAQEGSLLGITGGETAKSNKRRNKYLFHCLSV